MVNVFHFCIFRPEDAPAVRPPVGYGGTVMLLGPGGHPWLHGVDPRALLWGELRLFCLGLVCVLE